MFFMAGGFYGPASDGHRDAAQSASKINVFRAGFV
jgi:hypothetical protein